MSIGNSPSVKRFMKGVFELNPPVPRYNFVWDVNIVLQFLGNFSPNEDISLKILTLKCVMLLALSSMQRVQTLHAINVGDITFTKEFVSIAFYKLLKQSRPNNYKFQIVLKFYAQHSAICPALTLQNYIDRTKDLRGTSKQLFISVQKPYKPVSKSTVSRWIKSVMEEAGVDVTVFKSHSTRAASSSAARDNDTPIDDILKIAGWSNAATFKKFYDKAVL